MPNRSHAVAARFLGPHVHNLFVPVVAFFALFLLVPLTQLNWLRLMPGDMGDARLNNYFLEHFFRVVTTGNGSLWSHGFFAPMPYVIGFSDNLFGSAPVYVAARLAQASSETAFQLWFLVGYVVNFAASWYALRRLGFGSVAASVGAAIFTFALPTTAHAGHVQLHYRFGIPLAIAYLSIFLVERKMKYVSAVVLWTVWQFYCGIYNGFFLVLILLAMFTIYILYLIIKRQFLEFAQDTMLSMSWRDLTKLALIIIFAIISIAFLFFPYFKVSQIYSIKREWSEISNGLPRIVSFILSDASLVWGRFVRPQLELPIRHEHQMFPGVIPTLAVAVGVLRILLARDGQKFVLVVLPSLVLIILTVMINGKSIWYYVHTLPLFSAIRVLTRLDQIFLFPVAWLAALALEDARNEFRGRMIGIASAVTLMGGLEMSATKMYVSEKKTWRDRVNVMASRLPITVAPNSIVFVAQGNEPPYVAELDVMWWALRRGVLTLNGYSGSSPPGFSFQFGADCAEVPRRAIAYAQLVSRTGPDRPYFELMRRIVPIGFTGCEENWITQMPAMSQSSKLLSSDEFRRLQIAVNEVDLNGDTALVSLTISNANSTPISASSAIGAPVRLSWRFLDADGVAKTTFSTRKDLPFDVPANGNLRVRFPISPPAGADVSRTEFSLVQEGVFWLHDLGTPPAKK